MSRSNIYIPALSKSFGFSSKIVALFDRMRFEIDADEIRSSDFAEFSWFAREFPRYYRHHVDHAEFRIRNIRKIYLVEVGRFETESKNDREGLISCSIAGYLITQLYWEFEAFLNAISAGLDILSRVSGLEFVEQTPISLNNLSKKSELNGTAAIFRAAKRKWIDEMKDLRDCFVHYTPIDSIPHLNFYRTPTKWKVIAMIPKNPNVRVADSFKFSKRLDLLKYSLRLFENLVELDSCVADYLESLYEAGEFPKRKDNLFNIGQRNRSRR